MSKIHRLTQVVKYGWQHAGQICQEAFGGKKRLSLFLDVFACYRKYGMWSNQYVKERFWELGNAERETIGNKYREANLKKEAWVKDFYANRKFLAKWSKYEIETNAKKREQRNAAYIKHYSMEKGCTVEYGVEFSRQHHLSGFITIGSRCHFSKHVFIDYSGEVLIGNNVKMSAGVSIESHHRDLEALNQGKDVNVPTSLQICEGVYIGTRAIILDSCNYIGKNARIGAGAVVTKDVPDNAVVAGVPAKVIRMLD